MSYSVDKIRSLLFKYIIEDLSEKEREELDAWRAEGENERLFSRIISGQNLEENIRLYIKDAESAEKEWVMIRKNTLGRKRYRMLRVVRYLAASVILILGLVSYYYFYSAEKVTEEYNVSIRPGRQQALLKLPGGEEVNLSLEETIPLAVENLFTVSSNTLRYYSEIEEQETVWHSVIIPRGGEFSIILPDGTHIQMNAESELRYPVPFDAHKREVYLKGEAYFSVTPDSLRPFCVMAGEMEVNVLGTAFGVRSYPMEHLSYTTLVSGALSVRVKEDKCCLSPGQQALYNQSDQSLNVLEVNTDLYVGWKDGRMIFDNKPLGEILYELSRWYNFELECLDSNKLRIPFSLDIEKYGDISQVLDLLDKTDKVSFIVDNQVIIVK